MLHLKLRRTVNLTIYNWVLKVTFCYKVGNKWKLLLFVYAVTHSFKNYEITPKLTQDARSITLSSFNLFLEISQLSEIGRSEDAQRRNGLVTILCMSLYNIRSVRIQIEMYTRMKRKKNNKHFTVQGIKLKPQKL